MNNLSPNAAGRIMTKAVPIVSIDSKIGFIENLLIKEVKNFENINYIYVVDTEHHLKGVLSIKELFRVSRDLPVSRVMTTNPITVRPRTDRERVALFALEHHIKNIPVVDKLGVFLGVVPSDVILNALHQESIEDILRSQGILKHDSVKDFINAKTFVHFKKRLPWLVVGLFGGFVAALVVSFFENILSQMLILAAFIPSVVYIADAVGSQTETIFIQNMALNQKFSLKDYVKREILVGIFLAIALSVLATVVALVWWKIPLVAAIIGASFFVTILLSSFSGILLPWLFVKLKIDPAISSGPFSTVLRDIFSIIAYFLIAVTFFNLFR